jgi:hypothetical protein
LHVVYRACVRLAHVADWHKMTYDDYYVLFGDYKVKKNPSGYEKMSFLNDFMMTLDYQLCLAINMYFELINIGAFNVV